MCSSKANHQPSLSNSLILTISKFQIMKKTYIIPEMLTVQLGTCKMMAESVGKDPTPVNPGDFEVKEQVGSSKNVWDEEW